VATTVALAVLAGAAIVYGIVVRVVAYRDPIGAMQGDEALWGLMARHVLHGEVSAFFWGQSYGGTQEVFPVAALFWVFGTHLFLMRLVPIACSVVAGIVLWRIARRELGELQGIVAGLLLWIWPVYAVWKIEVWSGFYGGGLIYASLVLLLTLRLDRNPTRIDSALMGLVIGLAIWESVQTVAVILPALLWLTVRRPRVWANVWIAAPALVVGALPFVLSNLRHDWWSFHPQGSGGTYFGRLHGFVSATFPMMLGLRVPFGSSWLAGTALSALVYTAFVAVLAWLAWRSRHTPMSLFYVVLAGYPFLYAWSGFTSNLGEPRYVMMLVPALVVVISSLATTLGRAILVLGLAAALSTATLVRWIDYHDSLAPTVGSNAGEVDVRPAIALLEKAGIARAYADYFVATRMTFDTREQTIVSEADLGSLRVERPGRVLPPKPLNFTEAHHPAYDAVVRAAPRSAYVFVPNEPSQARDVALLVRQGYERRKAGSLIVMLPPQPSAG
jgi:hypothetical protein